MEWHVFLRARGHNDSKLLLNPNKIPIDSDKSQGSIAENPLKSAFKPAFLWWKHPTLMVTSPSFPGGVGKTRALEMMTRLLVESDEVLLVMGVPLVIIHFHGMFYCKPSIFGVATFLGNSQYEYCGWLRNPAAPKGWKPCKSRDVYHRFQLVLWISQSSTVLLAQKMNIEDISTPGWLRIYNVYNVVKTC